MTIPISFIRKEVVTVAIDLVDTNLTDEDVLEGLQNGQYKVMKLSREILNVSGGLVGHIEDWNVKEKEVIEQGFKLIP